MNRKKHARIAFIHPDLGIGGAERLILDMANVLVEENEIIFLTNHFDPKHAFDELKDERYKIEVFGDWIPRSIFGKCQALCAYIRMIYLIIAYLLFYKRGEGIDLFVVDLIPIAIPFLKLVKKRVIYYCHHPDLLATPRESTLKKLYRAPIDWVECKATKTSNITLVNSEYTASIFRQTFPEINTKLQVLYPTISSSLVNLMSSGDIIEKGIMENIPDNAITFLSINRYHPAKKLEMAIEALSHLSLLINELQWNEVYFIMAGGYDVRSEITKTYFDTLCRLTEKLNLEKKVIFLKSPSDSNKVQLLRSCKCLVYTPINEHFGIVPLEAMLAGKPIIASNSGGPRETVQHGENGYLCEPNSSSLAEFMSKLIKDNNFYEMGEKGRQILQEKFSNKFFANKLKNIVANTLKN